MPPLIIFTSRPEELVFAMDKDVLASTKELAGRLLSPYSYFLVGSLQSHPISSINVYCKLGPTFTSCSAAVNCKNARSTYIHIEKKFGCP